MRKVSFTEFAKTYGIGKRTLYNLAQSDEPPAFLSKNVRGHWEIDAAHPAAMELAYGKNATAGHKAALQQAKDVKALYEASIKKSKAMQEEAKTKKMLGEYVDAKLMRYYFSFFQRGITDSFAGVKKISRDMERYYKAGKPKEAERVLLAELSVCFGNAVRALDAEINNADKNE